MKVGLITYHSAYNFGSVLQAFATQCAVHRLGHECEVINYRIPFQKKYYGLLGYGHGLRSSIKKAFMIPQLPKRIVRQRRFESFIATYLNLTDEKNDPSDFQQFSNRYDICLSGSDQIWNIHSNEYVEAGFEFMKPYLLDFTEKKKVSYASSIANSTDDDLERLKPYLSEFACVSCRERPSAARLSSMLSREVYSVLDPTLLLSKNDWMQLLGLKPQSWEKPYCLYYSLKDFKSAKEDLKELSKIASGKNQGVIAITPLIPNSGIKGVAYMNDVGPIEFLNLILGAKAVYTDSYHGTLFALNFEKEFVYLKHKADSGNLRAIDVLDKLSLLTRANAAVCDNLSLPTCDYQAVQLLRSKEVELSFAYLSDACSVR